MKICSTCKLEKPLNDFPFQNKKEGKHTSYCKECTKIRNKQNRNKDIQKTREKDKKRYEKTREHRVKYAKEYRKKYPERTRATNWKIKYGITSDQFYEMLQLQDNKCGICGRDMDEYGKIFCVDHNHETNEIRGLLCDPCNYGLGFYEKYKDKYEKYLDKFGNRK